MRNRWRCGSFVSVYLVDLMRGGRKYGSRNGPHGVAVLVGNATRIHVLLWDRHGRRGRVVCDVKDAIVWYRPWHFPGETSPLGRAYRIAEDWCDHGVGPDPDGRPGVAEVA